MDKIKLFLESSIYRSEWIKYEKMQVYVRKNCNHPGYSNTFDVANIMVLARFRGKGVFTAWLTELEATITHCPIYVENVLEPRFQKFFLKRGYIVASNEICQVSFINVSRV